MQYKTILKLLYENKEPYDELLDSSEWKNKRTKILRRDGFCCSNCGKTSNLQVHHKYYLWNMEPWQCEDEALITLCGECHNDLHKKTSISWKIYINGTLEDFNFTPCNRCGGYGYINAYKHVEGGICFRCRGDKYEEVVRQWNESKTGNNSFIDFKDVENIESYIEELISNEPVKYSEIIAEGTLEEVLEMFGAEDCSNWEECNFNNKRKITYIDGKDGNKYYVLSDKDSVVEVNSKPDLKSKVVQIKDGRLYVVPEQ